MITEQCITGFGNTEIIAKESIVNFINNLDKRLVGKGVGHLSVFNTIYPIEVWKGSQEYIASYTFSDQDFEKITSVLDSLF
jgi:hypothetical protein